MNKPITLKDVAARAGVSSTAVSAVLSQSQTRHVRVSEETRTRILEAAHHLRYRPNRAARSLRSARTNVIGVYTAWGYLNPYVPLTSQIIGGLHQGCDAHHKDLLLHGMDRGRTAEDIHAELTGGMIDGLVLYTSASDPLAALLAESALPVIALIDALPGLPMVGADDAAGARLLAEHLAARGHHRVAYLPGNASSSSVERRRVAFAEHAGALGMDVTECATLSGHETVSPLDLDWLDIPPALRPTAAACWNDLTAFNLLDHCHRRGLRVPEDLAVVGFDGAAPVRGGGVVLATVQAPWVEVARRAVDLLIDTLAGQAPPPETLLPVGLLVGTTT